MQINQNPNATNVQATRENLMALFSANYPQVRSLKVKKIGRRFSVRAKFGCRCLRASSYSLQRVVIKFFDEVNQKVFLQPYAEA